MRSLTVNLSVLLGALAVLSCAVRARAAVAVFADVTLSTEDGFSCNPVSMTAPGARPSSVQTWGIACASPLPEATFKISTPFLPFVTITTRFTLSVSSASPFPLVKFMDGLIMSMTGRPDGRVFREAGFAFEVQPNVAGLSVECGQNQGFLYLTTPAAFPGDTTQYCRQGQYTAGDSSTGGMPMPHMLLCDLPSSINATLFRC